MSFIELINIVLLQWFFVRLTKHFKKNHDGKYTKFDSISLQYWVVPMSGWTNKFKYLNKNPRFFYLWRQ